MNEHEPYVGPRPFRTDEADRFFGRDGKAHEVVDHWLAERLGVLHGPASVGKTSLLKLLFLSLTPTRGQLYIFDQDVSRLTPARKAQMRRRIGIVFQDFRLLDHLTTWENVALPLRVVGKRLSDYKDDVTDLLQWVGLGDRMHAYPSVLSGGEKQRAAIARAVIGKPELLLADEPTAELESKMGLQIIKIFKDLVQDEGMTIVLTTHDPAIMEIVDQVYALEDGQIVDQG